MASSLLSLAAGLLLIEDVGRMHKDEGVIDMHD